METRSLPIEFELKAVSGRTIEGYAAAWARDRVNDIIDPKAFNRTIKANPDVAIFVGHDSSKLPVGEPIEMRADSHGLFTKSHIYDTPDGNALLTVARERLAKGKTLGMSIGFRTVKDHWDTQQKARILEDVDLIEYSFLASPLLAANPQAVALGVKSLNGTLEPIPDELQDEVRALITAHETKATMDAAARNSLSDSDYAYIDSDGGRHLPVNDEAHVRAAMSRFDQTNFESPAKKSAAARKILSRARALGIDVSADSAVSQAAKGGPLMTDLSDLAFAFIESGGTLDEEQKTVPRAKRHFAHHDETGAVDVESLKSALADPALFSFGDVPAAHILRHAQAAGVWGRKIEKDDAHEPQWTKGVASILLVREFKAGQLAELAAQDYKANEHLGYDTKDGMHVSQTTQAQINTEQDVWVSLATKQREIEQGIDGAARVEMWRTAFQLLDLEEVA